MDERVDTGRWAWIADHAEGLRRALHGLYSADEADDLTQETLMRAAVSTTPVPQGKSGHAWLRRIARNLAVDHWRRQRRLVSLDIAVHVPANDALTDVSEIADALRRLRRGDRALLQGLAAGARYAELARAEGVDASVIRKRAARARARVLAAMLEEKP